jgi:hypothetical protein
LSPRAPRRPRLAEKSQKPEFPPKIERIDSLEGEKAWAGTGERIGAMIILIET